MTIPTTPECTATGLGRAGSLTRRVSLVLAAAALTTLGAAGAAGASQDGDSPPEHGHMLVLGVEFSDGGVVFRQCVDVAAGKALPLHVHHAGLHRGAAGEALREAGNFPVPTSPLTPWANCAAFEAAFGQ